MLDNTLSLDIDELNNATTVQNDFAKQNVYADRSVYHGPDHSNINRELLSFYRSEPKKNGNFRGVAKGSFKKTIDIDVDGVDSTTTLTAPLIGEVSFSVPVGATTAQLIFMRQTLVAMLDDDTLMAKVMEDQHI